MDDPLRFDYARPVTGFAAVGEWTLLWMPEDDGDGFTTTAYVARGRHCDVFLDVSRFHFAMTQERFAWLAEHGFPRRPSIAPWDDAEVDYARAAESHALLLELRQP